MENPYTCNLAVSSSLFTVLTVAKEATTRSVLKKKVLVKSFTQFAGKRLCWSLLLIKLEAFRPATLVKRDCKTGVFL